MMEKMMSDGEQKARPSHARSARRRSRELALQGLYQWLMNPTEVGEVDAHLRGAPGFEKADFEHYKSLLHGCVLCIEDLIQQIQPFVDRPWIELSPVEKAVLLLATHEMNAHLEIPYRVIINEAVELSKLFGGTDAFKFVNGVLDKVAAQTRQHEAQTR
jgi:transcription antitermination protein NusB